MTEVASVSPVCRLGGHPPALHLTQFDVGQLDVQPLLRHPHPHIGVGHLLGKLHHHRDIT